MKQISFICNDLSDLIEFLNSQETKENTKSSESILVQIFARVLSNEDISFIEKINKVIKERLPGAVVTGMSTYNSICDGVTLDYTNVISFTFFEKTSVKSLSISCKPGMEIDTGNAFADMILCSFPKISCVLLFLKVCYFKSELFLEALTDKLDNIPIFGGAPCKSFENPNLPDLVFEDENITNIDISAVVFYSEELKLETYTYIGWEPLSREMTLTDVEGGNIIKAIDGVSPLSIYNKYLGTKKNNINFINALEFPMIMKKNDSVIMRPFSIYDDNGYVVTVGPFKQGDKVRIAYGNPATIIKNVKTIHQKSQNFNPEAIFIYNCSIRKIFMQNDINYETKPFQNIAPTTGGYTFGELCGVGKNTFLNEMSLVVVCMKENDVETNKTTSKTYGNNQNIEVEELSQTTLISRLVHFTRAVVNDLEEANKRLEIISTKDSLTGLYNRGKIDEILKAEIDSLDINSDISLILLDIDMFKLVNDNFGHHIGDVVLKGVADIINENLRATDSVGRWGGEEFLIILRDTNLDEAYVLAEKIRLAINNKDFEKAGRISASFGVMQISDTDDETKALNRVDAALYMAKNTGRNKVAVL